MVFFVSKLDLLLTSLVAVLDHAFEFIDDKSNLLKPYFNDKTLVAGD